MRVLNEEQVGKQLVASVFLQVGKQLVASVFLLIYKVKFSIYRFQPHTPKMPKSGII